tara:strand:- start:6600 stop:6764 length:165 start_codon:yes stop_codon:yes gene_type:complete
MNIIISIITKIIVEKSVKYIIENSKNINIKLNKKKIYYSKIKDDYIIVNKLKID